MSIPASYFYKDGFYWSRDESGPYTWDGSNMVLLGATGSATGGIATSSGSDITAGTVGTYGLDTYIAGIPWTITRDGSGVPTSATITGSSPAITTTLTRIGSSNYFAAADTGPRFVAGALVLTLAQMRSLESNILGALVVGAQTGFKVFVSDVGQYINPSNASSTPGAFARWFSGLGFLWETGVVYRTDFPSSDWSNSASQSGDLSPLTVPANVMGPIDTAKVLTYLTFNAGGVNTKTITVTLNGGTFISASAQGNTLEYFMYRKSIRNKGSVSAQDYAGSGVLDSMNGSSSSAQITNTINTSSTALTIAPRIQFAAANAADVGRVVRNIIVVSSDLAIV